MTMRLLRGTLALLAMSSILSTTRADVTVRSGPGRVNLLELYTSEGCSSCPPAEKWFSTLRQEPRLWKEFIPMAFHVDYWDSLGWPDPLANRAASQRQRAYAASWGTNGVYTPGFILNGQEWRTRDSRTLSAGTDQPGLLSATITERGEVTVSFEPKTPGRWVAHASLLGFGITSEVKAGENRGRQLIHDFAVLALAESPLSGPTLRTVLHLPAAQVKHGQTAFAVWITEEGRLEPVQAAGGDL